jgi:hypothetical protein
MKRLLSILFWFVFLCVLVFAGALLYSTRRGRTTWYFRVNGQVNIDGHPTSGYLHANTQKTNLLLTRTDESSAETYLVPLEAGKLVVDCAEWHPIRFLPMPVSELKPPCSAFNDSSTVRDAPIETTVVRSRRSVEFSTASGKKIKGEW